METVSRGCKMAQPLKVPAANPGNVKSDPAWRRGMSLTYAQEPPRCHLNLKKKSSVGTPNRSACQHLCSQAEDRTDHRLMCEPQSWAGGAVWGVWGIFSTWGLAGHMSLWSLYPPLFYCLNCSLHGSQSTRIEEVSASPFCHCGLCQPFPSLWETFSSHDPQTFLLLTDNATTAVEATNTILLLSKPQDYHPYGDNLEGPHYGRIVVTRWEVVN